MARAMLAVQVPEEDATRLTTTNNSLTVYKGRASRFPNASFAFINGALDLPPGVGFGLDKNYMLNLKVTFLYGKYYIHFLSYRSGVYTLGKHDTQRSDSHSHSASSHIGYWK